ncbi:hypothetical protein BDW67DRAFT_185523 [Aspergillus spinulosporus]
MRNSNSVRTGFQPSKSALGKVAAHVIDIDLDLLDWDKSFILLGGDSILAINFIAKCRDAGIHVDMAELLTAKTLGALAESIDQKNTGTVNGVNGHANSANSHRTGDNSIPLVNWQDSVLEDIAAELKTHGIAISNIESIAPCSAVQEGFFVSQAINPTSYISHISMRLVSTSVNGRRPATDRVVNAWRDIVNCHAILRTIFIKSKDQPGKFNQLVLKPNTMPPRVIICSSAHNICAVPPFTTRNFEPPLRLCAYEVSANELRLDLEISHALVDGHSGRILLHNLRASYLGTAYFSETVLPYTSFASQQQAALNTGAASAGVEYWTSYLNHASTSHLPLTANNPQLHHLETACCSIPLPDKKLRAYDLSANVRFSEEQIDLSLEYWASRIAAPVAKAQMTAFQDAVDFLLEGAASMYIRDFPSHSVEDRRAILRWNSAIPLRLERCVHNLVRDRMAAQPMAQAISAWDGEMTYSELDEMSRRLAYHLVERGVGPEGMVGLCMDKSKLGVVAMLAILRAGGAVVPLGVQHPQARIEGILKETSALVMLVDRAQERRLAALAAHMQLLAVDTFFDTPPATPTPSAEPCLSIRPSNAAWVMYTSGSTGKPKGVVLEHSSVATSILAHGPAIGIQPHDRMLQFAAYTFDVSIAEIMTPLSISACICVPSEYDRINCLTTFLSRENVTVATLTSTVAALVRPQDTPTIRTLILTGEALLPKVVDQWIKQATIVNAYGPSESSIWTTGTPLAGGFWVVNPANIGELVPVGVPGELLIEGPLLARGYLNKPVKTVAAFVTDPAFVEELNLSPGRRIYRTGDLVQQHLDGSLTYLGRRDTQVKIRGQRVEIGEIENQIVRLLPDAQEAIVNVFRPADAAHDDVQMLVAVIEYPEAGWSTSGGELELYKTMTITKAAREAIKRLDTELGQVLPAYMVPRAFLLTPNLLISTSGKLDRRTVQDQLCLMSRKVLSSFSYSTITKQAPTTAMEYKLQHLWAAVLSLAPDQIGINDSFFRLGGDSVVAMKLTAAAHAEKLPLSVADIFRWPHLVDIAAIMEEKYGLTNGHATNGWAHEDPAPLSLWPELTQADFAHSDRA